MVNQEITISAIITTYKRPFEILSRAIDSALGQTLPCKEVIVVDDNPPSTLKNDLRRQVVLKYGDSVIYIQNETNRGACASRNSGIRRSTGNYIAFLDDDDQWIANKNELMISCFDQKEIGLVYCDLNEYKDQKKIKRKVQPHHEGKVLSLLLGGNFIGGCSIPLIARKVFAVCGMYDETFPSSQDLDLWCRISMHYEVKYLDIPLVNYFIMDNSITRTLKKQIAGWVLMLDKFEEEYKKYPEVREKWINHLVVALVEDKDFSQAKKIHQRLERQGIKGFIRYYMHFVKGLLKLAMKRTSSIEIQKK